MSAPADDKLHPPADGAYFDTAHLEGDLRRRSVRGGAATLTAQGLRFAIGLGSTAALSRLVSPADYGLLSMVAAITNVLLLLKDLGLTTATVQRKDITEAQVNALFWVNTALGVAMTLVTIAAAPLIARFYGRPELTLISLAVSLTFLLGGLAVQHEALLRRQMRFVAIGSMHVISATVGALVGIIAGLAGMGYWALVLMSLAGTATELIVVWAACGWRPVTPARGADVRSLLAFGGNVAVGNILTYITRNLDNVLIGWRFGADPLGLYKRAYDLLLLPLRQFNVPLTHVALPALSRLQDQPAQYRAYYRKGVALLTFVGMPLVAFTFVSADPIVRLVLGEDWIGVTPLFQWLAPAAFVGTFNVATGWVFLSLGRADRQLRWMIVSAAVTVAGFCVGLLWGPTGVAASFSATTILLRPFGVWYCFRGTTLRMADLSASLWRPAVASIAAGAGVWWLACWPAIPQTVVARVAFDALAYGLFYLGAWAVLPRGLTTLREIVTLTRELRR